jgi:hypothetical protein
MDNRHQNDRKNRESEQQGSDERPSRRAEANDPLHHEPGAGITNRPDDAERENQERLPPRGQANE